VFLATYINSAGGRSSLEKKQAKTLPIEVSVNIKVKMIRTLLRVTTYYLCYLSWSKIIVSDYRLDDRG